MKLAQGFTLCKLQSWDFSSALSMTLKLGFFLSVLEQNAPGSPEKGGIEVP